MSNQITGVINLISPINEVPTKAGSTFKKRFVCLSVTETTFNGKTFTKTPCFEFHGEGCTLLDKFQIGQQATIFFDLDSRCYNERWYTTASGFRIEPMQAQQAVPQQPLYQQPQPMYQQPQPQFGQSDALPF
jgi:hypothetical protein